MKQKIFTVVSLVVCMIHLSAFAGLSSAKIAAPQPPADNPHPPVTQQDKQRVAFGEQMIKKLLMTGVSPENLEADPEQKIQLIDIRQRFGVLTQYRHAHIIPWSFTKFEKNRTQAAQAPAPGYAPKGGMVPQHSMVADQPMESPVLAADEYMIHAYVQFDKAYGWHHLDIIVSEDTKGNMAFRRFFIIRMPSAGGSLPDGVVC